MRILILPGDGIGPELANAAQAVLQTLHVKNLLAVELAHGLLGGAAIDARGAALPEETLAAARQADAVLLAAVGGPKWDALPSDKKPEIGLLQLRSQLGLYANLRPVRLIPELLDSSTLKPEAVVDLDFVIVRELTGGLYFGKPRGFQMEGAVRQSAHNTMVYERYEIERIARIGFQIARARRKKLTSVDKANVLEVSQLWREVVTQMAPEFPDVALEHMYVDNCALQLVRAPKQFDVILTENLFGDILSDEASMLTGSIAMLPSASLRDRRQGEMPCVGLFEPVHGSAPDLAGHDLANPIAMFLSLALLIRHAHTDLATGERLATLLETAISAVLRQGFRTNDLATGQTPASRVVGTQQMTALVIAALT